MSIVLKYIIVMLKHATPEQLKCVYCFLRGYLKTPLDELQREVEQMVEE